MILIATVKVRALKANTTKNVHSIMSTVFIKLRFMLLKRQKGGKNTSLLNRIARSTITGNLRHKRNVADYDRKKGCRHELRCQERPGHANEQARRANNKELLDAKRWHLTQRRVNQPGSNKQRNRRYAASKNCRNKRALSSPRAKEQQRRQES